MSGLTTETTTVRRHRADLAGGIRATVERACYGATLSLDDSLRRLTLTLTPAQVRAMSTFGYGWLGDWAWNDALDFMCAARRRAGLHNLANCNHPRLEDRAALAALAAAVLPELGGDDE